MKILILGGFLGSGKTSAILSIARHVSLHSDSNNATKVVIIENEIGTVGIDNLVLEQTGARVKNMFSGCICCSLSSDLVSGVSDIEREIHPEWVFIETTGLALPGRVAELVQEHVDVESIAVVVLIDASRWSELFDIMRPLVVGQVKSANKLLLNKIDLVSQQAVYEITTQLRELNPSAEIIPLSILNDADGKALSIL